MRLKKFKIIVAALAVILVIASVSVYFYASIPRTRQNVEVTMYEASTTGAAFWYVGLAEGFYKQNGLIVNSAGVSSTTSTVQGVAGDKTGFAFGDGDLMDILLANANNPTETNLIQVAETGRKNPVSVLYLSKSGITKPTDLNGKTIGTPFGSVSSQMFNNWAKIVGIDTNSLNKQNLQFASLHPALLSGKVDAIVEFGRGIGSLQLQAKQIGQNAGYFLLGDWLPTPLGGIVVQKTFAQSHPDIVQRIVNATMTGYKFCLLNSEKCIQDFDNIMQGRDYESTLLEWQWSLKTDLVPNVPLDKVASTSPLQLGYINSTQVTNLFKMAQQLYKIDTTKIDPSTIYTNQFVQQPSGATSIGVSFEAQESKISMRSSLIWKNATLLVNAQCKS